jgi:hypothetical protein
MLDRLCCALLQLPQSTMAMPLQPITNLTPVKAFEELDLKQAAPTANKLKLFAPSARYCKACNQFARAACADRLPALCLQGSQPLAFPAAPEPAAAHQGPAQ